MVPSSQFENGFVKWCLPRNDLQYNFFGSITCKIIMESKFSEGQVQVDWCLAVVITLFDTGLSSYYSIVHEQAL
jgi:hypothetical protein